VTDGLPALALGVDPISKGVMNKPPRGLKEKIIPISMSINILVIGILICVATLFIFNKEFAFSGDLERARTLAFSTVVVLELVRIYMIRSKYDIGLFSNKYLILAVLSSIGLHMLVVYTPLSLFFKTVPLVLADWGLIALVSLGIFVVGMIFSKIIEHLTKSENKKVSMA
jgi:Ca2+-transporting ATPase